MIDLKVYLTCSKKAGGKSSTSCRGGEVGGVTVFLASLASHFPGDASNFLDSQASTFDILITSEPLMLYVFFALLRLSNRRAQVHLRGK